MSRMAEWVDSVIDNPDVGDHRWFPHGWIKSKKGPVHVQSRDESDTAWCGDERNEKAVGDGPARVMLRRMEVCKNCEAKVGVEEEE